MYELLKKMECYLRVNFVGTGPSSYGETNLPDRGLTGVEKHCSKEQRNFRRGYQDKQSVVSQKGNKISSFVNKCKCEYKDKLGKILYIVIRRIADYSKL